MAQLYTPAFEKATEHLMRYEVGGFWNVGDPAVPQGLIDTPAHRRAVGYVDDPTDRGGETKFGIAKNANSDLDVTNLTWDEAKAAYYSRYWLAGKCDQLHPRVAALHYDGGVNHGFSRENKFLQRAVGVAPSGPIGPVTVARANQLDDVTVCRSICHQREQFYREIVSNNPTQVRFLPGWLNRVAEVRAFTTGPTF